MSMPTLIISIEGTIVKELALTKERTVLGRRPHNDVVMENLAVSGEHALLTLENEVVAIEDLNSTNGTFVNGFPVKRQVLADKDLIRTASASSKPRKTRTRQIRTRSPTLY